VLLKSLRTAELTVALITLIQQSISYRVKVLFKRLLAAKGLVAIIALIY
jgi:hypothetical protein